MRNSFFKKILLARDRFRYNRDYQNLSRKEIFENIYKNSTWGRDGSKYYSGAGSRDEWCVKPYCDAIAEFILKHDIKSVLDLGCGDFHVASSWLAKLNANNKSIDYTGADIVEEMINSHNKTYGSEHTRFLFRDIAEDELPDAELCIIREVLQHLKNDDIFKILKKLEKYKYVLVTESRALKEDAEVFNYDIRTGPYARGLLASGIYLDEAPFNLKIKTLLQIPNPNNSQSAWRGEMATMLIEH